MDATQIFMVRSDDKGKPVRDEDSTTYVGAIETAEEFGLRIYGELGIEEGTVPASKSSWSLAHTG